MLAILDGFRAAGLDPRATSLKVGIFGAEPWTNAHARARSSTNSRMHAVDIYGLSEVMGPGVANECVETKDGLHIWEDHFYPEIIDPETGAVLPERRARRARLHLADQGSDAGHPLPHPRPDAAAAGHRAHRCAAWRRITGRSDDMMIVRGVNVFPTQIEELILGVGALCGHYVIELTREGRLDTMTVRVEARPEAWGADPAPHGKALAHAIKSRIGVSALVEVTAPGSIERSLGKARRVIDRR